jgi:hypothetical protein
MASWRFGGVTQVNVEAVDDVLQLLIHSQRLLFIRKKVK